MQPDSGQNPQKSAIFRAFATGQLLLGCPVANQAQTRRNPPFCPDVRLPAALPRECALLIQLSAQGRAGAECEREAMTKPADALMLPDCQLPALHSLDQRASGAAVDRCGR